MNRLIVDFDNLGFWIKEFTDENGDTYIVEGECSRCGKCCEYSKFNVGFNDESGRCEKLIYETENGKVCMRCSIYENRPVGCVLWPRELQDLLDVPECTYKFIKK